MREYGSLLHLKEKYPDLKYYKSATRKSDGKVFKVGDEIQYRDDVYDDYDEIDCDTIIAFDHYDHPDFGKVKRAIVYTGGGIDFTFNCLHDIDFLRIIFERKVLVEKMKKIKRRAIVRRLIR